MRSIKTFIAIGICCLAMSCMEEEPVLSVEDLYSQNIEDDFAEFAPCDTVFDGRYLLTRAVFDPVELNTGEIVPIHRFITPDWDMYTLGVVADKVVNGANLIVENLRGVVITNKALNQTVYLIGAIDTDFETLFSNNLFYISERPDFTGEILGGIGKNNIVGRNYEINLYEIDSRNSSIDYESSMLMYLTVSSGTLIKTFTSLYEEDPNVSSQTSDNISKGFSMLKDQSFPFEDDKDISRELQLLFKDLDFVTDLVESADFAKLSNKNQENLNVLYDFIGRRTFDNFICHFSDKNFINEDFELPVEGPF